MANPYFAYETAELLKLAMERLTYNPSTGQFERRFRIKRFGLIAGRLKKDGYILIRIGDFDVYAHRLALAFANGEWPKGRVDHIDLCGSNNRLENLREATPSQNGANRRSLAVHGYKGITPVGNKWQAQISCNGTAFYLGRFSTPEDAQAAYAQKARELFGQFARVE